MTADALERRIRDGIPFSARMDFRILELTRNSIRVQGGEEENINPRGSTFAGSL